MTTTTTPGATADDTRFLLPRHAYSDPEWFRTEQRLLFARTWNLAGASADVARSGDYLTTTAGGVPILVVRDEDGTLRAFRNLCRHRGMVMVDGCGRGLAEIRCFYHDWRYATDGALRVVPQRKEQFPDLCVDEWGLLPANVGEWEGLVFVHPHPAATPLADALGALPDHIGSHRPGLLPVVATANLHARCNWKLLVENHIDVYHLWYLHRSSLDDLDHHRFEHHQLGPHWASYEPLRSPDLARANLLRGAPVIGHLDERDRLGVGAHLVFPNVLMAANAEFFMTYAVVPVAPDETRMEVRIRAEPGADGVALLEAVRHFIDEDIDACERIQAGLGAPDFEVGPLARAHEAPITAFHRHVLAALA
jgi:choline monooxygenase